MRGVGGDAGAEAGAGGVVAQRGGAGRPATPAPSSEPASCRWRWSACWHRRDRGARSAAGFVERAQRGFGGFEELAALGGQAHRKRAAVDQRRAGLTSSACMRRPNAGGVTCATRPRAPATGLRQADEVFEPTDVHGGGGRGGREIGHCSAGLCATRLGIFPRLATEPRGAKPPFPNTRSTNWRARPGTTVLAISACTEDRGLIDPPGERAARARSWHLARKPISGRLRLIRSPAGARLHARQHHAESLKAIVEGHDLRSILGLETAISKPVEQ